MSSGDTREGFRLSPQQKQAWRLAQGQPPLPFQTLAAIRIEGSIDPERLEKCLEQIVNRYEILRTRFLARPGARFPLQVIFPPLDTNVFNVEPDPLSVEEGFHASFRRPFGSEDGPILRASLAPVSPERHRLFLGTSSLCADSRSLVLLVRELSEMYGGNPPHPAEPTQYADLAEGQNALLDSDESAGEQGRAFWRDRILRPPPPLVLPFESERRAGGADRVGLHAWDGGEGAALRVKAASGDLGVSPVALLLSVWTLLLCRMSGQSEAAVAVTLDGRNFEELEGAVGMFARSVPIRGRLEERISFRDLARETDRELAEAEVWQDYFSWPPASERLGTGLQAPVGFSFEEGLLAHSANGTTFSIEKTYSAVGPGKLHLGCVLKGGSLSAECRFDSQAHRLQDVERLMKHFGVLLESVLRDPDCPVTELDLLDESQRESLLVTVNATQTEYPGGCVHERFEARARAAPDARAVVFGDETLTYGELNARSNRLAHRLRRAGVGPGSRVGLCSERSAETIVGLLGILKAGGAYVPLNPEHPQRRLLQQLADSESRWLLTQEVLAEKLAGYPGEVYFLDRFRDSSSGEPATDPGRIAGPEDVCYVIYTSGSTGSPKGVAVRHRSLSNYVRFIEGLLRIGKASEALQFALVSTIAADLGNTTLFPSLVSGGCLHVLSAETAADGRLFGRYCGEHRIDVLKIAPSHLESLLASGDAPFPLPRKALILGGEALSWDLLDRLTAMPGDCQIVNHYGPTEATVGSLTFPASAESPQRRVSRTVPIGRPIANTQIYVLDSLNGPVPVGVAGQLCIGGEGLAAGYFNRPDETRERFVPSPFDASQTLYKTGDLVRFLPDTTLEYLGRGDHQVKVRGFRVELEEVEAALRRHPAISQSVVTPGEEDSGRSPLTAYVVAAPGRPISAEDVRNFARESLPDYMAPGKVIFLRSLPLTPSGKVDRQALSGSEALAPQLRAEFVSPRTATEKRVAEMWRELMKLERVGVQDDFFDLGGHSLLVTQVVSRLRREFQIELPLRSVFEAPTVAQLAARIDRARESEGSRLLKGIEALTEEEAQALLAAELTDGGKEQRGGQGER